METETQQKQLDNIHEEEEEEEEKKCHKRVRFNNKKGFIKKECIPVINDVPRVQISELEEHGDYIIKISRIKRLLKCKSFDVSLMYNMIDINYLILYIMKSIEEGFTFNVNFHHYRSIDDKHITVEWVDNIV